MTDYRKLNSKKIVKKIDVLHRRIEERFTDAALSKVCAELSTIAAETEDTCRSIGRPHKSLRVSVGVVILLIVVGLVEALVTLKIPQTSFVLTEFVQVLEAGLSAVVLIGGAIVFLVTVEIRIKRSRTLKEINQLRVIAHVIDMHQLTKDPARTRIKVKRTLSSPEEHLTSFELTRYLDYCSEMLSLVGKVAALYAQNLSDTVILAAVNEVEILTTGLSRKVWQKIMVINLHEERSSEGSSIW